MDMELCALEDPAMCLFHSSQIETCHQSRSKPQATRADDAFSARKCSEALGPSATMVLNITASSRLRPLLCNIKFYMYTNYQKCFSSLIISVNHRGVGTEDTAFPNKSGSAFFWRI